MDEYLLNSLKTFLELERCCFTRDYSVFIPLCAEHVPLETGLVNWNFLGFFFGGFVVNMSIARHMDQY